MRRLIRAVMLVVLGLALYGLIRFARKSVPPKDYPIGWRADDNTVMPTADEFTRARGSLYRRVFDVDLLEKIILVAMIIYIFATMLPGVSVPGTTLVFYIAVLVTATTAISHYFGRRGTTVASGVRHFLIVFVVNNALIFLMMTLFGRSANWMNVFLFQMLLSVIVTLYDRFQPYREARFPREAK